VIVRPSSLGTNHLTLTWKVSDADSGVIDPAAPDAPPEKGIFFHVDIVEENKPRDELEIGTKLVIQRDKYEYEDLDEIVARFITPMVKFVNDLTAHKNFRFGGEAEIHQILFTEKSQDAAKFPYALHFATRKEKVGCFQFSFLPKAVVRASSFIVVPEGYSYRERTYSSLNSLIAAIKAEMSKQVGVAPPQGSREAAKQGRSAREKPKESLPPYAAAASSSARQPEASRPPYAAAAPSAVRPPPSSLPPYAGAAGGMPLPPYAGAHGGPSRPPYAGAPQPMMPPYAGQQGGGMMPPPPRPSFPMYGGQQQQPPQQQSYAPYAGPPYQQQPQYSLPAPPPPQQPAAPAAGGATSGYVHPSRLGIVSHAQPAAAPVQQPPAQRAGSRWGNARNDDMQM
jgi:transcription elongation factor SPT6